MSQMEIISPKSPDELEKLATGFASGQLFTGMHIALSSDYPNPLQALLTCFLPLNAYSNSQLLEWQALQYVPYQWVRKAQVQLSKRPPLYVFTSFEFMTLEDALIVVRYGSAIFKNNNIKSLHP